MTENQTATDRPTPTLPITLGANVEHGADPVLDRLNLEQALRDFELANRRVVDLAHRVASLNRELVEARNEIARLTIELHYTKKFLERLRASPMFPLLRSAARATKALRR